MIRQTVEFTAIFDKDETGKARVEDVLRRMLLRVKTEQERRELAARAAIMFKNTVRIQFALVGEEWDRRDEMLRAGLGALNVEEGLQVTISTPRHICLHFINRLRETLGDRWIEIEFNDNLMGRPVHLVTYTPPITMEDEAILGQGRADATTEPVGKGLVVLEGGQSAERPQ